MESRLSGSCIGAFFRAFGLVYLERLNATIDARQDRYGVMGVSFRSPAVRDALAKQDFVYTALERGVDGDIARPITSLCDVALSLDEQQRILAQMADQGVSIISLTVTEKGYCHREGMLDLTHPDIVHDIANPKIRNRRWAILWPHWCSGAQLELLPYLSVLR